MYYTQALSNEVFHLISNITTDMNVESYVIGGFVRDYFLHRKNSEDIDIVVVGDSIKVAKALSDKLKGKPKVSVFKNYGTAMLKYKNLQIEFVGARKESYQKESRKPIVCTGTLKDDQNRRDFTINALAFSLNKDDYGKLIDPFNGIEDLKTKIIKTPLNPNITYSDDPLRMLRAIRFATQLDFQIEEQSFEAIKKNIHRYKILSKERIVSELHKILLSEKPSIGFLLLDKCKLLEKILPELTNLKGVDTIKGQSHKDNFYHTLEVVDNISENTDKLWLRWAALLHDIGKAITKKFDPLIGWTFHSHEYVGSKIVYKLFKRLKMPLNEHMKYVQKIVLHSSRPIALVDDNTTDSAIRRLLFDVGEDITDLLTLCKADITTKNKERKKRYQQNFVLIEQKIQKVEERDKIRNFQPPITGECIMKTFNLQPCKEIGIIKDAIKDAILEGEIPNEYKAAYQYMIQKSKEMGLKIN